MADTENTMRNVGYEIEGSTLVIRVDLTQEFGQTGSGKGFQIATSGGNKVIAETDQGWPISLGLNVYRKNPDFVKMPKQAAVKPAAKSRSKTTARKRQAVTA